MQVVLIPAYMPDEKFTAFMRELVTAGFTVVSVDDGSGEGCRPFFQEAEAMGVTVVSYPVNKGKGGALKTGLSFIMENFPGVTGVITADCDGQHTIKDLKRVARWMKRYPDRLILGGRFSGKNEIPARSAFGNNFTRAVYKFATGLSIRDTQTGLRGIPAELLPRMVEVKGNRYEYEMNVLLSLEKWKTHFTEIPIETIYIDDNATSHYHPMRDSMRIFHQINKYLVKKAFWKLFEFIKFAGSSMVCYLLDTLLYNLLFLNVIPEGPFHVAIAYACARVISGVTNYIINSLVVFKRKTSVASFFKYVAVAVTVAALGSFGSNFLNQQLGVYPWLCKIIVDLPLFLVSFTTQKFWVFRKKNQNDSKEA